MAAMATRVTSEERKGYQIRKREGVLDVVFRVLPQQIGTVDYRLVRQIERMSFKRLILLAEALINFSYAADLEAFLAKQQSTRRSKS